MLFESAEPKSKISQNENKKLKAHIEEFIKKEVKVKNYECSE